MVGFSAPFKFKFMINSCCSMVNEYFDSNILREGPIPCQSNVSCEGPIPSSLCAMPIGLRSLCSCHDPYLHSWALSFHPVGRQRWLFAIATREDGVILSPCQMGAKPLSGLHTGHSSSISASFWAGNCCLRHPFSPVLKLRWGGGILLLCWTGLTWPQDIMLATMPALQYRHEAPPRLVAQVPHPLVHTGGGYYPRLASTFPALVYAQVASIVFYCAPKH